MSNADEYVDFLSDIPSPKQITNHVQAGSSVKNNLLCKHEIIAEWCATCKRMDTPSIKQVLLQENLEIVKNLLSWQKSRTT